MIGGELDLSIVGSDYSQDCVDAYGGVKDDWTCKDGANMTWDLDYCLNKDYSKTNSNSAGKNRQYCHDC